MSVLKVNVQSSSCRVFMAKPCISKPVLCLESELWTDKAGIKTEAKKQYHANKQPK